MGDAIRQFEINLSTAKQLGVIHQALVGTAPGALELSELLRAELVLAVSALDCFIHDLVRAGMLRAFRFATPKATALQGFRISLALVDGLLRAGDLASQVALLDQEIRRLHGFQSFQKADRISQAVALLGVQHLWDTVATSLDVSSGHLRRQLDLIVDRRDRIVHESDIDPTLGIGEKYPITHTTVEDAVRFIDTVAHCINDTVKARLVP